MAVLDPVLERPPAPEVGAAAHAPEPILYPESDGRPMADNTKQFQIIVTIHGGLAALFAGEPNIFVAGDLLWYPVQGDNKLRVAPDVMVAFGRPKGDRGAYLQWREDNIAPQVVFEILSPGNTALEMTRKFTFYAQYGVEEYYIYDPERGELAGWQRADARLQEIEEMAGWISPRLGVRFDLEQGELILTRPDGRRFETFVEVMQRADEERARADEEHARAERLADKLRALGIDPTES